MPGVRALALTNPHRGNWSVPREGVSPAWVTTSRASGISTILATQTPLHPTLAMYLLPGLVGRWETKFDCYRISKTTGRESNAQSHPHQRDIVSYILQG